MRSPTRPRVMWLSGILLLSFFGLGAAPAQGNDPGVDEFNHELDRARSGRHANFSKAISLLENAFMNESDNVELKGYLVRALAADGASLFRSGDAPGALIRFRRALSHSPTPEIAHQVLADLDAHTQLEMLVRGGEYRAIVTEFDSLRKEAGGRVSSQDSAVMQEASTLSDELMRSNPERRWDVQQELLRLGEISVPHLLPWLGNERDDEQRAIAISTLNRMRGDAVLPIIRGMDSGSEFQRMNVAIVLGTIGDARALAALTRSSQSSVESARVRSHAEKAIADILGGSGAGAARSSEYYWRKALDYYHQKESVLRSFEDNWIVWRWDPTANSMGNVVGDDVQQYAYNERLAEDALNDLLAMPLDDAARRAALALLISTYINQHQEAMTVAKLAEDQGAADFDSVAAAAAAMEQAMVLTSAAGEDLIGDAILRSVSDGYAHTSIGAINALVALQGDVGALSPALVASDKRVRYRAATAALALNPSGRSFANIDAVIPNLVDALSEVGVRAVLVIEDETEVRNRVIAHLNALGLNGYGAASGVRGLARATQYPRADVILVSDSLPDIDPRTVARRLADDYRTAGAAVVILSDNDKTSMNSADFVAMGLARQVYSKEISQPLLKAELDLIFSKIDEMDAGRRAANEAARDAAVALAALDAQSTAYPLIQAVPGLLTSVEQQGDEVRVPALNALRNFGDQSAERVVRAVLTSPESSVEAKSAAARALGGIYSRVGSVTPEAIAVLADIVGNTELPIELRRAAGVALGQSPLTPSQRIELMRAKRLH